MSRSRAYLVAGALSILTPGLSSAEQIVINGQTMDGQTVVPPPPPAPLPPGFQMPARDVPPKTGTARIRGRVVAADTGQPLRKAQVRASSGELRENRVTTTDAEGRYELKDLPAGRYQINVTKGSYVSLSYGQSRPFEAGKPLEILDAKIVEKVDFALPRGGIITGRVVDEFGEPIADVRVMPMRYQYVQGRRRLNPAGRVATTNDIGEYRIFGLAPGQYFLSATQQNSPMMMGDSASDDRSGYAPTYYPGTADASQAQRVTLTIGQALTDMNLALVPTRTVRVSGTAVDSNGKPLAGGMVMVIQRSGTMMMGMSGAQIKPDGTFTVSNLSPGDYMLQAMTPASPGDVSEMPMGQVTVAGEDVTGVQLMGMKSTIGAGRVIVDPQLAKSLPPTAIRVMATPARPEDMLLAGIGTGKVNDDYTFEVKARPGLALIRATLPPGWGLKAVKQHGNDVTDSGIEFRPNEEVSGIEVELTNQPTEVSGLVTNSRSEPVKDYTVVVFSKDRERWGYMSRFFQSSRPDQDGRYKVKALPAGEYYAVALDYVEPGEASDPEFLDRVKARATAFSLNDGETKTVDLKISAASS
jgi:protocatechuate 3,4-dioxygenase beta subunit